MMSNYNPIRRRVTKASALEFRLMTKKGIVHLTFQNSIVSFENSVYPDQLADQEAILYINPLSALHRLYLDHDIIFHF